MNTNPIYSALYNKVGWQPVVANLQSQMQQFWFFPPVHVGNARAVLEPARAIGTTLARAIHVATEDAFRGP